MKQITELAARETLFGADLEIARIKREAEKLTKVDAYGAYSALGALSSLRFEVDDCISNHERAIALSSEPESFINYAMSLFHMSMINEALDKMRHAYEADPSDLKVIEHLIAWTRDSGRFNECSSWVSEYKKRQSDLARIDSIFNIPLISSMKKRIDDLGYTDDEVAAFISCVHEVLLNNKVARKAIGVAEYDDSIVFSFFVNVDADHLIEMRDQLAYSLSEKEIVPDLPLNISTLIREHVQQ